MYIPEYWLISAAFFLVVGGTTVWLWLLQAKREGMAVMLDIFKGALKPHYDDQKNLPEDLGWAFIHIRNDISAAWTDAGRIKAFEKHAGVLADKMGEACVERGRRLALQERQVEVAGPQ